jgi:DNA-binding beta-propeller fold protein YncE
MINLPSAVYCTKNKIFVANQATSSVSVFNCQDFSFITSFCHDVQGLKRGGISSSCGIASYGDKYLFVADYQRHYIYVFQQSDYSLVTAFDSGEKIGMCCMIADKHDLKSPGQLCVSAVHQILIVLDDQGIFAFNLNDFALEKRIGSHLKNPSSICLSSDESSLYVGEKGNNQVVELNIRSDCVVRTVNSKGEGMPRFFCPSSIRLSADGCFLLLLESINHRISVFRQSDWTFVKHLGSDGKKEKQMDSTSDFCCSPNGKILVADLGNNRVTLFDV